MLNDKFTYILQYVSWILSKSDAIGWLYFIQPTELQSYLKESKMTFITK